MNTITRSTKRTRTTDFYNRMYDLGLKWDEIETLRRAQMTLHRWAEGECGDGNDHASWGIERDETTGKPFRVVYPHTRPSYRVAIADREKGALRRVAAIMAAHPDLWSFHQTDPRGCALYIGRTSDLNPDMPLDSQYNRGMAVIIA